MSRIIISERFQNAIEVHLIKNFSSRYSLDAPLILGIHGPPGEGKTFQSEKILRGSGVRIFTISPGQLESDTAGKPSEELKRRYKEASESMSRYNKPAALFINDLDLGIGHMSGGVQTTINTWLLVGDLMHLADFPTDVDGKTTNRVPIIITGNNFFKLHSPLLRPGRTKLFEWIPTENEKIDTISILFPSLSKAECTDLLKILSSKINKDKSAYKGDLPISFFSSLRNCLLDDTIERSLIHNGFQKTLSLSMSGSHRDVYAEITYDALLSKGISIIQHSEIVNHLNN